MAKNGKSGVHTNGKTTGRVHVDSIAEAIETRDSTPAPPKKKALVRQLAGLTRSPAWRSGSANIVERDGLPKYLVIVLDGVALQVPNEPRVIAWLQAKLTTFAEDKGAANSPEAAREVDDPIRTGG